jgi:hypothetical protein
MKVEIRNHFNSESAEARGEVSKTHPVMGVLFDKDENGNLHVVNIIAAKTLSRVLLVLGVKKSEIEICDVR